MEKPTYGILLKFCRNLWETDINAFDDGPPKKKGGLGIYLLACPLAKGWLWC